MRCTREHITGPSAQLTRKLLSLERKDLRIVVGLLTGHYQLKDHLRKIGVVDGPTCRQCLEEDETIGHIFNECTALNGLRQRHFGDTILLPEAVK